MTSKSRLLLLAALLSPLAAFALGAVVSTPQVRAELLAHAPEGVAPGKPLQLGLRLDHQPGWHTYWKNPGDSGLPTLLNWQLPAGFAAGEIEWPTPKKLPVGPLMNFGFEGTLLLPVTVTVPAGFAGATLPVKLQAEWLVCKEVCIPEMGEFSLDVPVQAATALHGALFASARAAAPQPAPVSSGEARVEAQSLQVRITGLPAAWHGKTLAFLPEDAGVVANAAPVEGQWRDGSWTARVPLDAQRTAGPALMPVVLVMPGAAAGLRVELAVQGPWPEIVKRAPLPPVLAAAPTAQPSSTAPIGLGLALLFALVGGALLNLMPCVFPVLSLKVIGFAKHAHDRPRLIAGGMAYTAGVVVSFVALAGLLLALRAGGEGLGWGFQLQSPGFVALLAALFTLIGLNLAGVFDFGNLLPGSWGAARARHPLVDSALTGVLAVAVASPCTAPFMGASLGLALTLPAAQALLIFAALGLGMALPFLAASIWPAAARALPRPGAWMVTFRTLMAFPMFATVVWLVWVLGRQTGVDGAAALLATLLALAFVAWALGSPALGRKARAAFGALSVLLFGAALAWSLPALRTDAVAATTATAVDERWQPWSTAAVAEGLAQGRPVFVDFTAAWCVTCQYNKRTTLSDARVLADFETRKVLLLRADWTRRDADISAELSRLGRHGVPVYAVYAPSAAEPRILNEFLTVAEVRGAIAAAQ